MLETEALLLCNTSVPFEDLDFIGNDVRYLSRYHIQNKLYFSSINKDVCKFIKSNDNPNKRCLQKKIVKEIGFFLIKSEDITPENEIKVPEFIISSKRYQLCFSRWGSIKDVFLSFDYCTAYDLKGKKIINEHSFIEIESNFNDIHEAMDFALGDVNVIIEKSLQYCIPYMGSKYEFFKEQFYGNSAKESQ